ncbi:MAG: hypothetical protein ACKPKO_60895, partial [Candidatus Fonsibacter sp.]
RNQLIQQQYLPRYQVHGVSDGWSWYYALPRDAGERMESNAVGLQSCCIMSIDAHSNLGKQFNDPISAIHGLVFDTALRNCVVAELATIRAQ